jgi:hypothetical protein
MRLSARITFVLLVAVVFTVSATAPAAVIPILGGDSTDGWAAAPSPLFAYNMGDAPVDQVIQSVTFKAWSQGSTTAPLNGAGITVSTNTSTGSNYTLNPPSYALPNTNDNNMRDMMDRIFYNGSNGGVGPLTFTMTNLVAGKTYLVDAFTYSDGASPRANETFSFVGATTTTDTFDELHASYLVEELVIADGTGKIVINITSPNPTHGTPILSGLVLTAPEPSSAFLGVMTAVGGLLRRRAKHQ